MEAAGSTSVIAGGPGASGSARVMGNTVRQWRETYDRRFGDRVAQEAVDDMQVWRSRMLRHAGGAGLAAQPTPVQAGGPEHTPALVASLFS
jgi:hypothetical protein